ncbi:MAG: TIGR01777 family protein [Spartobacteria bacterium Tous-C9RFEB]|nr:MAG: TIGR01777 family protein [Spartobacteria bacterium Tous-C9RFEB]
MKIGIIGATGYIGSRLQAAALRSGQEVVCFSRNERSGFRRFSLDAIPDFSGLDAVVNLAGESILGLWTSQKKEKILRSRVETTRHVMEGLSRLPDGPRILINASAIGYYGDTGENPVSETSPAGTGFLAQTCKAWEEATQGSVAEKMRIVRLRIGFVTGPGGAMRFVLPLFKMGLGGPLGNGRQWMSCIHVDDVAGLILWAIANASISGPVNAVCPEPVRNTDFTRALARAVHRPAILPAPAFALRLALGELSRVMLDSIRVIPEVALTAGYSFRYPNVEAEIEASVNPKA